MKRLLMMMAVVALAGCKQAAPTAGETSAPAIPTSTTAPPPDAALAEADWQGYGPLQLGTDAEQLRLAWGGELQGEAAADGGCYYLHPDDAAQPPVAFMIEEDSFVRYEVEQGTQAAPGGGHIGMTLTQLQQLYPRAEAPQPHKYDTGAHYLRVPVADGGQTVLMFEVASDGTVQRWRVGLPPQVDYVEGCS
jgi:hypothetical protein